MNDASDFPVTNTFHVIGVSHENTSQEEREFSTLGEELRVQFCDDLSSKSVASFFILSTCNRWEVYFEHDSSELVLNSYVSVLGQKAEQIRSFIYTKSGSHAMRHFFEVGAGMRSQIKGDFEIIGQIRKAYRLAKEAGHTDMFTERLVNMVTVTSKRIKNETKFSSGVTSSAYAAVRCIRDRYHANDLTSLTIYGTGKIGKNVCENLVKHFASTSISIINRSKEKADELAQRYALESHDEAHLSSCINKSEVLIVATGADEPTVDLTMIQEGKPMTIIDLSMPRNVDPRIDKLKHVDLIDLDALAQINDKTLEIRQGDLLRVKAIVEEELISFERWQSSRKYAPAIQEIKSKMQVIQRNELARKKRKVSEDQLTSAEELSDRLIQKFTTHLFQKLKNLPHHEFEVVQRLFDINIAND